jgi:pimeloyl-ACP methyl ester carboxylesterase
MSAPAVPILGDLLRYTLSPPISRLLWPTALKKLFGPAEVPAKFNAFPKELAFRPSQIRASAEESALMIPDAFSLQGRYTDLKMPVVIIAGEGDRLVDTDDQSARLHEELPQSTFHRVAGAGHMVHQTATARVLAGINEAIKAGRSTLRPVATHAA